MIRCIGLAVSLSFYSLVALAQQKSTEFKLIGTLVGCPINKVSIAYIDAKGKRQGITDTVKNDTFTFRGNIDGITSAKLIFEPANKIEASNLFDGVVLLKFFLEPNEMTLLVDVANLVDMKVTGTKTQNVYNEFLQVFWPVRKRLNTMMNDYYSEKNVDKQESLSVKMVPLQKKIADLAYRFATEHSTSFVSADLAKTYKLDISLDSLKYLYDHLASEVKLTSAGKALEYEVKRIAAGSPGSYAATFTKNDINGIPISLSDFKGKYVLLDFWASWCRPCRAGNPHLLDLYKRYKGKGLEIIGISDNDHNPASWREAVNKDGIGVWRHVLRGYDTATSRQSAKNPNDLSEQYGIDMLPTKILIDPTGKIIGRYKGTIGVTDPDLDHKLSSIFN